MSPDTAMDQYVTMLSDKVPRWKEETCVVSPLLLGAPDLIAAYPFPFPPVIECMYAGRY